uniref:Ribonuclease A-domain domain-containing protein n=1 Tax=Neogobius melanostomus TaxID=47308 RepID=A0A8C6TXX3_9GOBI
FTSHKSPKSSSTHVIQKSMHKNECSNMMETKQINQNRTNCKKTNTFIRAPIQNVTDVCKNGKETLVNKEIMRKSLGEFDITVCKVEGEGKFPKCKYKGEKKKAKIIIKCTDVSLPVHFHDEADYEDYVSTIVH